MKTKRQKVGRHGEDLAVRYLKKKRYRILERNYIAGHYGELDIIAEQNGQLIFIEVKTKTDQQFGLPEQEFNYYKRKKMRRAIQNYLFKNYNQDKDWQADLIAIDMSSQTPDIRHYQNIAL